MTDPYDAALELAGELLGRPLELPLGPGEPESGRDFRRLATLHTFGDSWTRTRATRHPHAQPDLGGDRGGARDS